MSIDQKIKREIARQVAGTSGVSQKELAKHFGVSKGAISQQVKKGMPTSSIEDAAAWRATNLRRMKHSEKEVSAMQTSAQSSSKPVKLKRTEPLTAIDMAPNVVLCQRMVDTFAAAGNLAALGLALKNLSLARTAEQANIEWDTEHKKAMKELISRDEVTSGVTNAVAEIRRKLLSLGARLTGRITPEAARIVDGAVDEMLRDTNTLKPIALEKFSK